MKIRSNRRKRRRYGRGRSDRKVFYARAGLGSAAVIDNSADLNVMHLKKARRDAGGCGCVQTGDCVQLLDINEYSRPGIESDGITGIVIHYTANPGSTAQENRDYFEGLKDSHETSASSNFVVGLEGEIIQCVPTWEVAYASNERNKDTISIECCHPDETGKFTEETYQSMVQLTAWLCRKYSLTADTVIRHYDVTGKNCPKYFVENEEAWANFKEDVANALAKGGTD